MKKLRPRNWSGMSKVAAVLVAALFLCACAGGVVEEKEGALSAEDFFPDEEKNILLIVGEGGVSGGMFIKAAETFKRDNGGEIYHVANGDEFVEAVRDFVENFGEIDRLEYFGHGNEVGLYVNQAPGVNGALYANDPDQNRDWLAASFYDLPSDVFAKYGWVRFNGCNVAKGYPGADNLAQRVANYFEVDVVAPLGPTEFSRTPEIVNPIPETNYLSADFDGDVYMVPTYGDAGFVVVHPLPEGESGFVDVREGDRFEEAVNGLVAAGLELPGFEEDRFWPYNNISYDEAVEFCKTAFGEKAECSIPDEIGADPLRNLRALQILVDNKGVNLSKSTTWYLSYISWASDRKILTPDFVNRKWYTRAEMAELTWGIMNL